MPLLKLSLLASCLLFATSAARAEPPWADDCGRPEKVPLLAQGCTVLDNFMTAFNAGEPKAWAATLNFPHVHLAGNEVQVWSTAEEYARQNDVRELGKSGWSRSRWDWRRLIQQSPDKLHFLVQFTRFGADDKPIGSYESLYIVTRKDGHWGVQARSSYAGIAVKGSAF